MNESPAKLLQLTVILLVVLFAAEHGRSEQGFYVPANPPSAQYKIESRLTISDKSVTIEGTESVTFKSALAKPLSVVAVDWSVDPANSIEMKAGGTLLHLLNQELGLATTFPLFFELPKPLQPGEVLELGVKFTRRFDSNPAEIPLQKWYPALWWEDIPTRNSFKVRFAPPPGYVMAMSGRLNKESGYYENEGVTTTFGIYLARDMRTEEKDVDGVLITSLFNKEGEECARLCLNTAADIIPFYKSWLGIYPFKFLYIIPGGPGPWGGYPYASGIVVIHGQQKFSSMPLLHWKWITAHEIGHQYWGEYVMSDDYPYDYTASWLMIGMGIRTDKSWVLSRNLGLDKHLTFFDRYLDGVKKRYDTTVGAPPSLMKTQKFDLNNVVIHGKGFSILSALESVLGKESFEAILKRCLKDYGGRRLGWRDFWKLCEQESGQNLSWFFEPWVRSNKYLCYQITSRDSAQDKDRFVTQIRVESALDSIQMPIPVEAVFEDGSSQIRTTDRLLRANLLKFESRSKLKEAILDPDHLLAMLPEPLPVSPGSLREAISELPWTGSGNEALRIFKLPDTRNIVDADSWFKLGLTLFDGGYTRESLESFTKTTELNPGKLLYFAALVWIGHDQDLLGDRGKAIAAYTEALKYDTGNSMQHSQYGMIINRQWVEDRLKTPFKGANR
jgi:tetratricopeptide (TPR) repeat protein